MKKALNTIRRRWKAQMPIFFKWLMGIGTGVATVAVAIQMALNSSGAITPQWWESLYPYLIGIGAGVAATAKLTQEH